MPSLLFSATSQSYILSSMWLIFFPLKKQACQGIQDIIQEERSCWIYLFSFPGFVLGKKKKKCEQLLVKKENSGWSISHSSNRIRMDTFGNSAKIGSQGHFLLTFLVVFHIYLLHLIMNVCIDAVKYRGKYHGWEHILSLKDKREK